MAKANRQRFNFLTALLTQLEQAAQEGDELYESFRTLVQGISGEARDSDTAGDAGDRLDAHAQWLAALEARVEDVEQAISDEPCEEADGPDDGLDDEDMGGHEPDLGGLDGQSRRDPPNLVRAGERPLDRRNLTSREPVRRTTADKELLPRGTRQA